MAKEINMPRAEATAERIKESVPEATDLSRFPEGEAPMEGEAAVPEGAPAVAEEPAESAAPSRRDSFSGRFAERYPDLDMEDEDAYYDQAEKMMDEHADYEGKLNAVRESVGKSPEFAEMLAEASEQEQFSPVLYVAKKLAEKGYTLEDLQDPKTLEELTKIQAEAVTNKESKKQIADEGDENFDSSIELMKKVRDERGLSNEQINAAMEKAYEIFEDLKVNKISEDTLNLIIDSMNYADDVETARQEGVAEGMQTRVTDKLRKLPTTTNRAGGRQGAVGERQPEENNSNNMFGV